MAELNSKDVKEMIDLVGPGLGYDLTYDPLFPETRKDVCAVRRLAENGSTYGFDTIYLVWSGNNKLNFKELINSKSDKDYINIGKVYERGDSIIVEVSSGGSYSGGPWKKDLEVSKKSINLK